MSISVQEALDASNAVYSPNINLVPPGGFTILTSSALDALDANYTSDGFFARTYVNSQSHIIIIAYEGSLFDFTSYGLGTEAADAALAIGQRPAVLDHAVTFASDVETAATADGLGGYTVYVTGHSLGGTEAEAAALALNNSMAGGFISGMVTFAATGLPGYLSPGGNNNFINYVDYGDPVGNYARDSVSELSLISATGSHFGSVDLIGSPWHAAFIDAALAVATVSGIDALPAFLGLLGGGALLYHPLANYASDLGLIADSPVTAQGTPVPLPSQQTSDPNTAFIISQTGTSASPPVNNNPHPVVEVHPSPAVNTNSTIPLPSLFTGNEASAGPADHIDHYSAFIVRGAGSLVIGGQTYGLGSPATNISPAEFATATFSAGPNAGVTEVAVVAFDNLGNSSIAGDTTITVIAPAAAPQPIISTDHTPPVIVPPSQQLVTGVGSEPNLTSNFLQVTDANSANYTRAQLVYTITSAPSHGYLLKNGSIVSSFTQADIDNQLVEYQENGTVASSDSFSYFVSDPAGDRSTSATFTITINAPPTTTHPILDTDTALSVGQGQTALITSTNLHVTDSGLSSWQIIYTVTGGATHGRILADGINVVQSFTQQQVDLGLISYQNSGNVSGQDNLTFTVSDTVGGTIGQSTLDINVIPKNNLTVGVERPLFTDPEGQFTLHTGTGQGYPLPNLPNPPGFYTLTNTPGWVSLLSSDVLASTDLGVDPSDITYTVLSMPSDGGFLVGQWGTPAASNFVPFSGSTFGPTDIADNFPHSFTQAQVDAGQVFYDQQAAGLASGQEHYGDQFSVVLSAADNAGNSLGNIVLPVIFDQYGLLTNGTFVPRSQIPAPQLTAAIGARTIIGPGLLDFISNQFSDTQITYSVWFTPSHGSLFVNGVSLAKNATFSQQDIDEGRLAYSEDGSVAATDSFGFFVTDPNQPGNPQMAFSVGVALTGAAGGQALTGQSGDELLSGGIGNNYFFGDGSTTVSYANAPNGVSVDLLHGTASNGYGGTDTLTNIHDVIGSAYADTIIGDAASFDIVTYSSDRSDYVITRSGLTTTVAGPGGTDTLTSVKMLQFADGNMPLGTTPHDFKGVGTSDVLLYNAPTGTVGEWLMQNGLLSQAQSIASLGSNSTWSLIGTGDLNGDGTTDVLLYNAPTGTVGEWLMQNGQLSQAKTIASLGANSGWSVGGTGDFNGDGTADVLLYNAPTGIVGEWQMQNGQLSRAQTVASLGANSGWSVVGTGDFDGDGTTDVLLYNAPTGTVGEWLMQNGQLSRAQTVASLGANSGWSVVGTGDFNGDGTTDVLLYNAPTGTVGEWLMQNGQLSQAKTIASLGANSGWSVAGTGDFNGDGTTDIAVTYAPTGTVGEWLMHGGQLSQASSIASLGANSGWSVPHV